MKTCRRPSRGSTHSAVRTIQGADSPTVGLRSRSRSLARLQTRNFGSAGDARAAPAADRGCAIGSTGRCCGASDAATHGKLGAAAAGRGRIAGDQKEVLAAQHPEAGLPFRAASSRAALERQHDSRGRVQPALEDAAHALALLRIFQAIVDGIDVDRQLPFALQIVDRVFERRDSRIPDRRPAAAPAFP